MPLGLVIEAVALIVLALTNPLAEMLLAVRLVKLPLGLVIEFGENIPLALITPLELIVPVTIKPFFILNSLAIFYISFNIQKFTLFILLYIPSDSLYCPPSCSTITFQ